MRTWLSLIRLKSRGFLIFLILSILIFQSYSSLGSSKFNDSLNSSNNKNEHFDYTVFQNKNTNENIDQLILPEMALDDQKQITQQDIPKLNFPKNHPMNNYSDVLVIVNNNSVISKQIGDYFQEQRNIPDKNMCIINTSTSESIDYTTFHDLRGQVEDYIQDNNLTQSLNYLVTTKGVPLKMTHGTWTRRACVDSELCLILGLYSQYIDNASSTKISNRFFNKNYNFARLTESLYLVTRLTGYNFSDVKRLIDNAAASANQRNAGGSFLFDRDPWKTGGSVRPGNSRMSTAHNIVSGRNYPSTLDTSSGFQTDRSNLAGYASWGTFDNNYYSTPVQNRGFDSPASDAVHVPNSWEVHYKPTVENITRNNTVNRSVEFSVNITRTQNDTGFTFVSQNVTIKADVRYYVSGYVKLVDVANYDGGGAILQLTAYNSVNDIVWQMNSTRRYGGPNDWLSLYQIMYEPIPGVTMLRVAAGIAKSKGTAFFDDVALWEIKPHNSYVPGAIGETYGYSTGYTMTNPHWFYRLTVGDLIMDGITGVKGYVDYTNSYIDTNTRVDVLFERYTNGFTLADSYYMATPYLSWLDVVIGDPKTAPYFEILPDGKITADNITFSNNNPNQGDSIKIKANVENLGGSNFNNVNITFKVGNEFDSANKIQTKKVPQIPSKGTLLITCDWNIGNNNGTKKIWVYVDYPNEFREQNEENNVQSKDILINSFPYGIELKFSKQNIYRSDIIQISINVSDIETAEPDINCSLFFNHSTMDQMQPLENIVYTTDRWQAYFESNLSSYLGWYHITVIVKDGNDALIEYKKSNAFEILNNLPTIGTLKRSKEEIYRTDQVFINFTVNDIEDTISKDMIIVQIYNKTLNWLIPPKNLTYLPIPAPGKWQFIFQSNISSHLGNYDVRVTVTDKDSGIASQDLVNAFEIFNNKPIITSVMPDRDIIYRSEFAKILITGYDIETESSNIEVVLEYRLNIDTFNWSTDALTKVYWVSSQTHWEASFNTNRTFYTGNYLFRAKIIDSDSVETPFLTTEQMLLVVNNPPSAIHNIKSGSIKANEDELINFDGTNSTDFEDIIGLKYHWDFDDGNTSNKSITTHSFAKAGIYNVSLKITDLNLATGIANFTVEIKNVNPVAKIQIVTVVLSRKVGQVIEFDGTVSIDTKSDKEILEYYWEFNEGNTSEQPIAYHQYKSQGTKLVKLTVTDDNGATHSVTINIDIAESDVETDGDDTSEKTSEEIPFIYFIIFLILVLIIILAIAGWAMKKKSKAGKETEEGKKPVESVEATIVDAPEFISTESELSAGKTVKPKKVGKTQAQTIKPKLDEISTYEEISTLAPSDEIKTLPPSRTGTTMDGVTVEPEVEVEFVPEVKMPAAVHEEVTGDFTVEQDESGDIDSGLDFEVQLPSTDTDEVGLELPVDDEDFVPPKIDLTGIMPEPATKPVQTHKHEITEAQKRGEGVALDFKKPKKGEEK